ncbi:DUF58 domain-containing protein [Actinomycetospora sp.]|uniref:DUF58 domain-containing protein n=1 Tax=Actinomycetospora sp. TaxID=1872135 RepID=UPI002F4197BB
MSGDEAPARVSWWPRLLGRLGVAGEGQERDDDAGRAPGAEQQAESGSGSGSGEFPVRPPREGRGAEPYPPSLAPGSEHLDASLRTLELTVRRRLDGLLQGNHLGLVPGPGSEAGDARAYQPGDDVRRMDWSVTARTSEPHIRETIADRELEVWLVVDLSPSLDFGTGGCEKRDLAVAACAAVVHLTRGGGNRVGAIVATGAGASGATGKGAGLVRLPARGGTLHAHGLMRRIAATPRAPEGTRGDLLGALEALRNPPRRRGLAVVISDFLGDVDWDRALRGLAMRHEVLAIEVGDERDEELPDVGTVVLADPESGHTREVTTTPTLRRRFAAEAAAHRDRVAAALRGAGAGHLRLRTDRDWIADVVRFVVARKRGWSGQGTTSVTGSGALAGNRAGRS